MNKNKLLMTVLHPYLYTFGIIGPTGSGKTTLITSLTTQEARKILSKSVGETNSTITERCIVFSEKYTEENEMLVGAKKKEILYKWGIFTETLTKACVKVTKKNGKVPEINIEKASKDFEEELKKAMDFKFNNIDAILSFLAYEEKEEIVNSIKRELLNSGFFKNCYQIYCTAKNSLDKQEIKDNSQKLNSALFAVIGDFFDDLPNDIRVNLENCCKLINQKFEDIFFKYFDENYVSDDGYYYYRIDLSNEDNEEQNNFIDAFFTANNLQNNNQLSVEVFCKDIVIYVPMHKSLLNLIKSDNILRGVFLDQNGNVAMGYRDTQGFFHAGIEEGLVEEYASNLVYGQFDALILLNPLAGDTNNVKAKSLYSRIFENYSRDTPIFILNNKVDMLIDKIVNESIAINDDIFISDVPEVNVTNDEIIKKVDVAKMEIQNNVIAPNCKKIKNLKSFACFFKKSSTLTPELAAYYNTFNAVKDILVATAEFLKNNATRIKFSIDTDSNINVNIDREILKDILENEVFDKEGKFFNITLKKVISPAIENISENLGITPHGNGYNTLGRKLPLGQGHTSNIDENYFYNCKSFSINFPGNLRNLITNELLIELLTSIGFDGGQFENEEAKKEFLNSILDYVSAKDYSVYIAYNKAFLKAEDYGYYGFGKRFNDFLRYSLSYLFEYDENIDVHIEAIEYMLKNAVYKAIGYKILLV